MQERPEGGRRQPFSRGQRLKCAGEGIPSWLTEFRWDSVEQRLRRDFWSQSGEPIPTCRILIQDNGDITWLLLGTDSDDFSIDGLRPQIRALPDFESAIRCRHEQHLLGNGWQPRTGARTVTKDVTVTVTNVDELGDCSPCPRPVPGLDTDADRRRDRQHPRLPVAGHSPLPREQRR